MSNSILPDEAWKSWPDFNKTILGKKIVFFGVSDDWTDKTLQKSKIDSFYFVDNSPSWIGSSFDGVEVKNPEVLREKDKDRFVVITSGAYESIYPQLAEYGLKAGADFCVSPAMNNLKVIADIHTHDAVLLVSSPDHKIYSQLDTDSNIGGGLFTYNIKKRECKKVLDGTFHQIAETNEGYYAIDEKRGVCQVDKDFELVDTFGCVQGDKSHGIAYCPQRNLVLVSRTAKDKITAYNANSKKRCFDIEFTNKAEKVGKAGHWINDLCVRGDYLYISMFSYSGAYLEGVYDGCIVQVHLDDTSERHVLVQNLWMPHSVCFFDSEICFADSMLGYFYKTDKKVIGEFFGFIRGLAYDGSFYYIGQSETRHFDRLKGIRKNIGMNAGFYLFDEETKAAKFFTIPRVHQIRDLVVLK